MPSKVEIVTTEAFTISTNGKKVLIDPACRATCTTPNIDALKDLKEPLALDIEFQEFRPKGAEKWGHRMGRVALVNTRGQTVYDVYVRYDYDAGVSVKLPPKWFNVEWKDLQLANGAQEDRVVRENLYKIMYGRTIIGHDMRLDITAVGEGVWMDDPKTETVHPRFDTQSYYGRVALGTLADKYLDETFDFHDPTEDARATMLLYLRVHPYKGRTGFKGVYTFDKEEFPALGK